MNKLCYSQIMKYYSVGKKKLLGNKNTWRKSKNTLLSERSHSKGCIQYDPTIIHSEKIKL